MSRWTWEGNREQRKRYIGRESTLALTFQFTQMIKKITSLNMRLAELFKPAKSWSDESKAPYPYFSTSCAENVLSLKFITSHLSLLVRNFVHFFGRKAQQWWMAHSRCADDTWKTITFGIFVDQHMRVYDYSYLWAWNWWFDTPPEFEELTISWKIVASLLHTTTSMIAMNLSLRHLNEAKGGGNEQSESSHPFYPSLKFEQMLPISYSHLIFSLKP